MAKVELNLLDFTDLFILKTAKSELECHIQSLKFTIDTAEREIERSKDCNSKDIFDYYTSIKEKSLKLIETDEKALERVKQLLAQ